MSEDEQASSALDQLARACGVTRAYWDGTGRHRRAGDEAVASVLSALGEPLRGADDAPEALRARREAVADGALEPILCATPGRGSRIALGSAAGRGRARVLLTTEAGEETELSVDGDADGQTTATLPAWLAPGYHNLTVQCGERRQDALLLAAPSRLPGCAPRSLGLFAPLYALHSERTREVADYGELSRFARFADELGADYVATLPLLDVFADSPFDPSPYAPISRCFWSELFVDVQAAAAALGVGLDRPAVDVGGARSRRVDYRRAAFDQRRALEALLAAIDAKGGDERDSFDAALAADPALADYAAFRATVETQACTWPAWPTALRDGHLSDADFDRRAMRVHAYAQILARLQLGEAARAGSRLYLDFPLGSHADGYDTWRHRRSFAMGIRVGAPPDALFTGGQDWGFPPLHPRHQRRDGYASLRAALRHHFDIAGLLRIDHVMGLHRLFWIAPGLDATEGVYVAYPEQEIWSIVAIEAARVGAAVVGEDLGTVPDEVRREMEERGALRMFVLPFEVRSDQNPPLAQPPQALACLGTHDTATFAAWWQDLGEARAPLLTFLRSQGLLAADSGDETAAALEALLLWLATSDAAVVLVSLEDLLLESQPQNRPGTPAEAGNWVQRTVAGIEEIEGDSRLRALLQRLALARRGGEARPGA